MFVAVSSQSLSALGEDVFRGATRNLDLLRAIDQAIATLCYDQRLFKALATIARDAAESIRNSPRTQFLDPKQEAEQTLLKGQQAIHAFLERLSKERQSALADPHLTDDDGVVDEYGRTIQIATEVHNAINNLRWSVSEHDADVREKIGTRLQTYEANDIEKLIANLI